jgi:hypothetical protein
MATSSSAAARLRHVATATTAAGSSTSSAATAGDTLPGAAAPPPRPLTDDQLRSFIEDGFVALPVAELPPAWHASFAGELFQHSFQGTTETQPGSGLLQAEQLTTLLSTATVRGALQSVLGEDYVQYPNRALQSYGTPEQEVRTRDDKWHKDQCYVPIRHHRTRWAIIFYFPATVTRDMGGTGVMPGSAYTTIDHDERAQDTCVDTCEDFLASGERAAAKRAHLEALAHDGAFEHGQIHGELEKRGTTDEALQMISGFEDKVSKEGLGLATAGLVDDLHGRPAVRQAAERECEHRWGVGLPRSDGNRRIFGADSDDDVTYERLRDAPMAGEANEQPTDRYMTLPDAGTIVLTHYDTLHRGSPRLPHSRWRPMIRMKFFRVSETPLRIDVELPDPRPVFPASVAAPVWMSLWSWYTGAAAQELEQRLPQVADVLSSPNEIERIAAGYVMANHAALGSADALGRLEELLLCEAQPVAQRAGMYGFAAAGQIAVPTLLRVLRRATSGASGVDATGEKLNTAVRAVFALGEAALPTTEVLDVLAPLLAQWLQNLHDACAADPPPAGPMNADGGISMLAAWHRASAVSVQALSLLAERVDAGDEDTSLRIAGLLLPLTQSLDPLGGKVPHNLLFTGSGCAAWWISEGAAIGLLRLVSSAAADSGAKSCLARGHVVKASAPATQNDQRFVQALCMLALQRSLAALGPDRELTKVLSGAFSRWAAVYSDASGGEAPVPTEWYRMA